MSSKFVGAMALAVAMVGGAHASLVTNGGFELGSLSGWSSSAKAVGVQSSASLPAAGGTYYAAFGAGKTTGGWISQDIATVASETYTLEFDYGGFQAATNNMPQSMQIDVGGVTLGTVSDSLGGKNLSTLFQHHTYSFVASSATTTIRFSDLTSTANGRAADGYLDNVVINSAGTAASSSDLPEPASLALVALAGLGLVRSRRRRA